LLKKILHDAIKFSCS